MTLLDKAATKRLRDGMVGAAKGGRLAEGQVGVIRKALTEMALQRNPGAGRVAAVREADSFLGTLVTPKGRVKPAAGKKAPKAKGPAAETLQQKVNRLVQENLTAALGPKAAPGAGTGPGTVAADSAALMSALAAEQRSPFYRPPADAPAPNGKAGTGAVAVTGAELAGLAVMDSDQLRSYAAGEFKAMAAAGGFGSPIWS